MHPTSAPRFREARLQCAVCHALRRSKIFVDLSTVDAFSGRDFRKHRHGKLLFKLPNTLLGSLPLSQLGFHAFIVGGSAYETLACIGA